MPEIIGNVFFELSEITERCAKSGKFISWNMDSPNTSFSVLYTTAALMFMRCGYKFDVVNAHRAKYFYYFFLVKYIISRTVSSRTSVHRFNAISILGNVPDCIINSDWKLLYKLCPPQNPHAAWTRTRVVVVGSQRLTAWATAWLIIRFGYHGKVISIDEMNVPHYMTSLAHFWHTMSLALKYFASSESTSAN
jgi:hypothetical protein